VADSDKDLFETESRAEYGVTLPCAPEDFAGFVSGLLGKAQTIGKLFSGAFEITSHDIANTFHLVDQRIRQQNEASLVQFTVRIVYDDNSSVLINSLAEFLHYTEIKPLVSVAAYLSWTYLIKFQDKRFPEKQQIEMAIVTDYHHFVDMDEGVHIIRHMPWASHASYISIQISHTARTWGADVEALLTGHIKTLLRNEKGIKKFISQNSGWVGFGFGMLFFALSMVGAYLSASHFIARQAAAADSLLKSNVQTGDGMAGKIDFLIQAAAQGTWQRFDLMVSGFFVLTIILTVILAVWVGTLAVNPQPSFLLISKKAFERKIEVLEKRKRKWLKFAISLGTSTATGIAANVVFAKLFGAWFK
jgi:hypothetical protein